MNTLTPEPVSNETRIRQLIEELGRICKNDNDAPRFIAEQVKFSLNDIFSVIRKEGFDDGYDEGHEEGVGAGSREAEEEAEREYERGKEEGREEAEAEAKEEIEATAEREYQRGYDDGKAARDDD